MKHIFIFLAIINVAYFFYGLLSGSFADDVQKAGGTLTTSLKPIVESNSFTNDEIKHLYSSAGVEKHSLPDAVKANMCVLVGPFESLLYAEYFQEEIVVHQIDSQIHLLSLNRPLFEIVIDLAVVEENPLEILMRLQKADIEGFLVEEGERKSISLGRFIDEATAIDRKNIARSLGLEAQIIPVDGREKNYWVEINNRFADKLSELVINGSLREKKLIEIKQNVCLGIANN